ncbi:unnamed protein product [Moneuplotes crassus]|uniref:Uncharacterized protein n=1 Tax=Euplotes crassus TaxID=5936 RepID=A0AAD1XK00_EUPCR|nr:unnamed protein product [Moneuplotes crassus]
MGANIQKQFDMTVVKPSTYHSSATMFSKFSLMCEILPFLGFYPQWEALLLSLNNSSRQLFDKNKEAFKELNSKCLKDLGTYEEMFELCQILRSSGLDNKVTIPDLINYEIQLKCVSKAEIVEDFLTKVTNSNICTFPRMKKFWVSPVKAMSIKSREGLKHIFDNISFKGLNSLYLQANDLAISSFMPSLKKTLLSVRSQVYLKGFMISKDQFRDIIEGSSHSSQLILCFCVIGSLGSDFILNSEIEYKIDKLSLYGTCIILNPNTLNEPKLKLLIDGMNKTSLTQSLKSVEVYDKWYPARKVQKLFDEKCFEVEVSGKKEEPTGIN